MPRRRARGPVAVSLSVDPPTTPIEGLLLDLLEPSLPSPHLRQEMLEELTRPVRRAEVVLEYLGLKAVDWDVEGELPLLLACPTCGSDPWRDALLRPGGDCPIGVLIRTSDRKQLAIVHEVFTRFSDDQKDLVRRYTALAARGKRHAQIVATMSEGPDGLRRYTETLIGARRQIESFLDPSVLVSSDGEIRVQLGSLSETMRNLLREGLRGEYVFILPQLLFEGRTNYADIEFLVYLNFFVRQGQRTRLVGTARQRRTMERLLTLAIFGLFDPSQVEPPSFERVHAMYGVPDRATYAFLRAAHEAFSVRATPDASRAILGLDAYIDFSVLDESETVVPIHQVDQQGGRRWLGDVRVRPDEGEGVDVEITQADGRVASKRMAVTARRRPCGVVPEHLSRTIRFATDRPRFGVTPLGTSHGFDPAGDMTSFVVWVNGIGLLVDPSPEALKYLEGIGVAAVDIPFVFLTHVHADHDGGLIEKLLSGSRTTILASDVVCRAFAEKVQLVTGHDFEREGLVTHIATNPGAPITLEFGGEPMRLETRWNLHPIPTNGFKISVGGRTFGYSGDTRYDPDFIEQVCAEGTLTRQQREDLLYFFWRADGTPTVDLLYHEAGIPPIHTAAARLADLSELVRERTFLVHIADKDVPLGSVLTKPPLFATHVLLPPTAAARNHNLRQTLRLVSYLYDIPTESLARLLEGAQLRTFDQEDVIIRRGSVGTDDPLNFYVVADGEVAVRDGRRCLALLNKGDSFGEWGISHQRAFRVADVVAARAVQCLEFTEEHYRWLVRTHPVIQERIAKIRRRLPRMEVARARARLKVEANPFERPSVIVHMTSGQLASFVLFSEVSTFKQEQPVVVAGAESDGFYVLLSGHLVVTVAGRPVGKLSEGDVFGEIGLLEGSRRDATVTVTSVDAEILFMSTENFNRLVESAPAFGLGVRETAVGRQDSATRR